MKKIFNGIVSVYTPEENGGITACVESNGEIIAQATSNREYASISEVFSILKKKTLESAKGDKVE